jgi:hypothetical protein
MTTAELERIARDVVAPGAATSVVAVVDVTPGGRLASGVPSGIGVETRYGAAFFDGLRKGPAIAWFPNQRDAYRLIELLDTGRALRSTPRSVAALTPGSAERGVVQSAPAHPGALPPDGRRWVPGGPKASRSPVDMPVDEDAGSEPGVNVDPPGAVAPVVAGALCAACGTSLADFPPSRTGQKRKTCGDACRKAYQRGHRAPVPGVVAPDAVAALSRLPRHLSGFGRSDQAKPSPAQLPLSPLS